MFGLRPYNRKDLNLAKPNDFFTEVETMFENFFNSNFSSSFAQTSQPMKVDIKDEEQAYVLEAELPGVDKDNIHVELRDNYLTISVENKEETIEERENYVRKERHYGSFTRSFFLDHVKHEAVHAKFDNGILRITLPKDEVKSSRNRRIDIN